jgi:hypothetical protein
MLDESGPGKVNFSVASQKFLKWKEQKEGLKIARATTTGERRIGKYRVDGYIEPCQKYPNGKAIEYHGCFWHYHSCMCGETQKTRSGESVAQFRQREKKRVQRLLESTEVEIFYECEVQKMLDEDPDMKKFFDECVVAVRFCSLTNFHVLQNIWILISFYY